MSERRTSDGRIALLELSGEQWLYDDEPLREWRISK